MLNRSSNLVVAALSLTLAAGSSLPASAFAEDANSSMPFVKDDAAHTAYVVPLSPPVFPQRTTVTPTEPQDKPAENEPKPESTTPISTPAPADVTKSDAAKSDEPIVIDNDQEKEADLTKYTYNETIDASGKTHVDAGAKFPVIMVTSHTSKNAKIGDAVEGRLGVDIKINGHVVAVRGNRVIGHVSVSKHARKLLLAEISPKRWMRPSGCLSITFDEIVTDAGEHLPLVAAPAQQARIVSNKAEGRILGVNKHGEIASPLSGQVKAQLIHLAIRGAASAGGVFSMGAVPVAYGMIGAINPSFAFMHPVGTNVRHRRLKGFAMGAVSGLPGGFLISDSIIRGSEAIIKPGDQFLAEFKEEFTGEPAVDAQLIPGAKIKVHGEIQPESLKKSK